ncbi:hypothetical protein [uncultured Tateyamaria sp.]|uniref:hypothetical protein n=1 Tax=uncultured Tateyamaria sp. TaxID=455651 RepID=UPI0026119507|nr:hypothetical protein [uncultured Tateyamaria sp.]
MSDLAEQQVGAAVLALAGNEPDADEVEDASLVGAWIFHQLVASAPIVQAVLSEGDEQ